LGPYTVLSSLTHCHCSGKQREEEERIQRVMGGELFVYQDSSRMDGVEDGTGRRNDAGGGHLSAVRTALNEIHDV
jgi:hypothetical protein